MKLLTRFLLSSFLPIFIASLLFFVLVVQLVDLFGNLVRYLNLEIPLAKIVEVQLLYIPKAMGYALPIALLFATGFTLGTLYSNNELIAVFGSGTPIWVFVRPLILLGLALSLGSFFFQEYVIIDTFRQKNELSRDLLNMSRSFSNTNVTARAPNGELIYTADYYNDVTKELSRVLVLERSANGDFLQRIDASYASWDGERWTLHDGTRYYRDTEAEESSTEPMVIVAVAFDKYQDERFFLTPRSFQRSGRDVQEMRFDEAREWVNNLKDTGQQFRTALTDYYERFAFSLTPFIVVFLSSALGGRFRKNVLLMSLLVSLVTAVIYYVTGMVMAILSGDGVIPPLVGAWAGVVLFTAIGMVLFRTAKT